MAGFETIEYILTISHLVFYTTWYMGRENIQNRTIEMCFYVLLKKIRYISDNFIM